MDVKARCVLPPFASRPGAYELLPKSERVRASGFGHLIPWYVQPERAKTASYPERFA